MYLYKKKYMKFIYDKPYNKYIFRPKKSTKYVNDKLNLKTNNGEKDISNLLLIKKQVYKMY